jgi:hypothetical protein
MRRLALIAMLLAFAAGSAAPAHAKVDLKRHESQYWVWYAPKAWVAAQGFAGIDISSPDSGRRHVGYGFSGTAFPVTHDEVLAYLVESGGLDLHPLQNVGVLSAGPAFAFAGGVRRVYQWAGFRTDLGHRTRGVLKIDVFNDDSTATYGFAATVYNSPKRRWRRAKRLLRRISNLLFYKPHEPFGGSE